MTNTATIVGRLVREPELQKTANGTSYVRDAVACDRNYKNKATGQYDTDFFNVVAWRGTAEYISRNCKKGDLVTVNGRLQTGSYTDKDGNKRTGITLVISNVDKYFPRKSADNTEEVAVEGLEEIDDIQDEDPFTGFDF